VLVSIAVLVRVLIDAARLRLERMAIRNGGSSLFPEQARGSRPVLFDAAAGAWDRRLGGGAVSPNPLECLADELDSPVRLRNPVRDDQRRVSTRV